MITKQNRSVADVIDSARLGFEVLVARIRTLEAERVELKSDLEALLKAFDLVAAERDTLCALLEAKE
jgi:hypothetical protein